MKDNIEVRDIQRIVECVRSRHPEIAVTQLQVKHPGADDDGVWCFTSPKLRFEFQLESTSGNCPFLIESNSGEVRVSATSVADALELIESIIAQ